jgi:hypothetical protein
LYKSGIAGLQAQAEGTGATAALEAARTKSLADALSGLFGVQAAGVGAAGGSASSQLAALLGGGTAPDTSGTVGGLLGDLGNYLFGGSDTFSGVDYNPSSGGGLFNNDGSFYYDPAQDFWAD